MKNKLFFTVLLFISFSCSSQKKVTRQAQTLSEITAETTRKDSIRETSVHETAALAEITTTVLITQYDTEKENLPIKQTTQITRTKNNRINTQTSQEKNILSQTQESENNKSEETEDETQEETRRTITRNVPIWIYLVIFVIGCISGWKVKSYVKK